MLTPRKHLLPATLVILALAASAASATPRPEHGGNQRNPVVLPPGSSPYGKTYAEWSAEHWKWLLSIPAATNPANDFTGANGAIGQSGPVWFLCGSFCPEPPASCSNFTVTRNLTVPIGTALFFPILDAECSTAEGNGTTDADLRACAAGFQDLGAGMACEVDGEAIANLQSYRVQSPLFTFGPLPDGNIFGLPGGTTSPSVSDGVFLMIRPLSAGPHTIHFTGGLPTFGFGMDITYHLTVGESVSALSPSNASAVSSSPSSGRTSAGPTGKPASWGKLKLIYR